MTEVNDDFDLGQVQFEEQPRSTRFIDCFNNTPIYARVFTCIIVVIVALLLDQVFALWICIKYHGGPGIAVFLFNLIAIGATSLIMYAYTQGKWIIVRA